MVALGTNIYRTRACDGFPLTTSLQQSNLFGDVYIGDGGSSSTFRGEKSAAGLPARKLPNNTSVTCDPFGGTLAGEPAGRISGGGCRWVWHDGLVYVLLRQPVPAANYSSASASARAPSSNTSVVLHAGSNATRLPLDVAQPVSQPVSITVSNQLRVGAEINITQGDNTTIEGKWLSTFTFCV
jgi:hypothetical protein